MVPWFGDLGILCIASPGVGSAGGIFFAYILIGSNSTHFADGGKMDNEYTNDL